MKFKMVTIFILAAFVMVQVRVQSFAAELSEVSVVQTAAKAINYRNLKGAVEINFKGSVLLPNAAGTARIKNKSGLMVIQAEFNKLTPATQFGHEYLTYILWAISPDGRATNLGEIIVKKGSSRLSAKTPMQAMSLIVTAEPYFAVSQPSSVVVLENAIQPGTTDKIEMIDSKYELLPQGQYTKNISATDLHPQVMDKKTPFAVYQARNAVRIARAAGAEAYAADSFKNAEKLLASAETKAGGKKGRTMTARQAVQSAEDSRAISSKREAEAIVINEHQIATDMVNSANSEAAAANAGRVKAEHAQLRSDQARRQSDSERSAALALASSAAAASATSQADAKAARVSAAKSQGQADEANSRAQKAEGEKSALRAQLLMQFSSILQTRDTARGLIVDMPDTLFKSGSSVLGSPVREKLAKIAGIVVSNPGLKISVEGHTDSVGGDEYNQRLSENRAASAKDYLVSQGVEADSIKSRGFGKNDPVGSNETAQGRQKNRRIEIVVSGAAIDIAASAR